MMNFENILWANFFATIKEYSDIVKILFTATGRIFTNNYPNIQNLQFVYDNNLFESNTNGEIDYGYGISCTCNNAPIEFWFGITASQIQRFSTYIWLEKPYSSHFPQSGGQNFNGMNIRGSYCFIYLIDTANTQLFDNITTDTQKEQIIYDFLDEILTNMK
jgi:hypothetical protein